MERTCFCNKSVCIIADAPIHLSTKNAVRFNADNRNYTQNSIKMLLNTTPLSQLNNHYSPIMPNSVLWCPVQLRDRVDRQPTDFTSPLSQVFFLLVQSSKDSADKLSHMRVLFFRAIFPLIQTHARLYAYWKIPCLFVDYTFFAN